MPTVTSDSQIGKSLANVTIRGYLYSNKIPIHYKAWPVTFYQFIIIFILS